MKYMRCYSYAKFGMFLVPPGILRQLVSLRLLLVQ